MSFPFVVHSRLGQAVVADTLDEAKRLQRILRGVITCAGRIVVEAIS